MPRRSPPPFVESGDGRVHLSLTENCAALCTKRATRTAATSCLCCAKGFNAETLATEIVETGRVVTMEEDSLPGASAPATSQRRVSAAANRVQRRGRIWHRAVEACCYCRSYFCIEPVEQPQRQVASRNRFPTPRYRRGMRHHPVQAATWKQEIAAG